MPSDDTFRKQLQHVIAALETWAKEMEPWAKIELGPTHGSWHVSAIPHAPTACPFEIILRPDRKFDMMIGGEIYEDQPLDALTDIPQMVRSISNGNVLIRRWRSQATGLLYSVETVVDLPGTNEGHFRRRNPNAPRIDDVELEATLETFAPYRR